MTRLSDFRPAHVVLTRAVFTAPWTLDGMRKGYVWWCVDLELDGAGTGDGALEVISLRSSVEAKAWAKVEAHEGSRRSRKRGGVERQRGLRTELRGELCGPRN